MIDIRAVVKGEDDLSPFTKIFHFDNDSGQVFFNGVDSIKNRLSRNLRININETLMFFSAFIVSQLHDKKPIDEIAKKSKKLLTSNQVMVGVPQSLQKITFYVQQDDKKIEIIFDEPIPAPDYLLVSK